MTNEITCNRSLGNVIPLALAWHNANSIINGTTAFPRPRQLKWGATWLSWSCAATGASVSITWCWWHNQWNHCISQVKTINMRCNIAFLLMWCHVHQCHLIPKDIVKMRYYMTLFVMWCHWHCHHLMLTSGTNGTIANLGTSWSKWDETWPCVHDTNGTIFSIVWYWLHHQCHHYIP